MAAIKKVNEPKYILELNQTELAILRGLTGQVVNRGQVGLDDANYGLFQTLDSMENSKRVKAYVTSASLYLKEAD